MEFYFWLLYLAVILIDSVSYEITENRKLIKFNGNDCKENVENFVPLSIDGLISTSFDISSTRRFIAVKRIHITHVRAVIFLGEL